MKYRSIRLRLMASLALIVSAIILALEGPVLSHPQGRAQRQYLAERETLQRRLSINLANPVLNWDLPTVELNL